MDALRTEVQIMRIPRPKFYCSKGQLRVPADYPSGYQKSNGKLYDGNRGQREYGSGLRFYSNGNTALTSPCDESDYPAEPPKDYYDDELDVTALSLEDKTKSDCPSNLSKEICNVKSDGIVAGKVIGSTVAKTEIPEGKNTEISPKITGPGSAEAVKSD